MNLTELLAKIGMANVKIQRVDESIVRCKSVAGATHLTLVTNQVSVEDVANLTAGVPLPVHGLILWIPRALLESPAVELSGAQLIAAERERQRTVEGYDEAHDDYQHGSGELTEAAMCYAEAAVIQEQLGQPDYNWIGDTPNEWPWDFKSWKPSKTDAVRNLVKAGALIAAEIDRLLRAAKKP